MKPENGIRKFATGVVVAAAVSAAFLLSASGGESSSDPFAAPPEPHQSTPGKEIPLSAGDKRPVAPDDAISERPGGPKDDGDGQNTPNSEPEK